MWALDGRKTLGLTSARKIAKIWERVTKQETLEHRLIPNLLNLATLFIPRFFLPSLMRQPSIICGSVLFFITLIDARKVVIVVVVM